MVSYMAKATTVAAVTGQILRDNSLIIDVRPSASSAARPAHVLPRKAQLQGVFLLSLRPSLIELTASEPCSNMIVTRRGRRVAEGGNRCRSLFLSALENPISAGDAGYGRPGSSSRRSSCDPTRGRAGIRGSGRGLHSGPVLPAGRTPCGSA